MPQAPYCRFMKNTTILSVIALFLSIANPVAHATLCEQIQPMVKSGDLIFISSQFYVFKKVSEATNTWANHVGIAFERNGKWVVAESRVPLSKVTPFCDFVERTFDNQIAVRRVSDSLTEEDIEALWENSQEKMGILYHLGFDYRSHRQFCSKFVYQIYGEALGMEVGKIQTFREVLAENPEGSQEFWNWWFLGNIPWERETVTPRSQLYDPNLETIYTWEDSLKN